MGNDKDALKPTGTVGAIRAAISEAHSSIPAAEFLRLVLVPPMGKRRDEWLQSLYDRLHALEQRVAGFRLDALVNNDAFISAALQASQAAVRTHEREKLEALRNAVLNVAAGRSADADAMTFFLALVDSFSATHLELLRYFDNRARFPNDRRRQFEERRTLTDPMVLDLNARGLLEDHRPIAARNRESLSPEVNGAWTISALGKRFLQFISAV
jgi:hypothetical protein